MRGAGSEFRLRVSVQYLLQRPPGRLPVLAELQMPIRQRVEREHVLRCMAWLFAKALNGPLGGRQVVEVLRLHLRQQ